MRSPYAELTPRRRSHVGAVPAFADHLLVARATGTPASTADDHQTCPKRPRLLHDDRPVFAEAFGSHGALAVIFGGPRSGFGRLPLVTNTCPVRAQVFLGRDRGELAGPRSWVTIWTHTSAGR
jgi:hypothetical protein